MYWFDSAYEAVSRFMDMGGDVLWAIAVLLFLMWALIFERILYFQSGWKADVGRIIATWESRSERQSWNARQIREKMISQASMLINQYLPIIIEVFNIMAVTGGGDAKSMAGGVSRATVPTMAGMVAAISGLFANTYITRNAKRQSQFLEDNLTMDH